MSNLRLVQGLDPDIHSLKCVWGPHLGVASCCHSAFGITSRECFMWSSECYAWAFAQAACS
jgi:hypothetical protein